ncbi:DUF1573 domain-containing protein [Luteolibacter ambystomatis]|uniref:DUF1573 domain-containing protein n=1 Tax=Luteolibacter ambystomatis TaxID=2824561 RepID=A0A975J2K5_9BACT|nr:DUF1573 domain-containing protein [Luteolibacter ambystomatis]QUE52806.1 DUF1573 domain-containing protein [Luteolibacter ambystomatis]
MRWFVSLWLGLMPMAFAGRLTFTETSKTVDAKPSDTVVKASFPFTNKSGSQVSIRRIESSCSCLASGADGKKVDYAPGESGKIEADFDVGASTGVVEKQIAVWVEGDPADKPSAQLILKVKIPEVIVIEPKTAKWDVGGEAKSQTISFTVDWPEPVHLTKVTTSSTAFKHELKTVTDGKKYELVITPVDSKQPNLAVFHIDTDCKLEKYREVMAYAVVRRPLASEAKPATKP